MAFKLIRMVVMSDCECKSSEVQMQVLGGKRLVRVGVGSKGRDGIQNLPRK